MDFAGPLSLREEYNRSLELVTGGSSATTIANDF